MFLLFPVFYLILKQNNGVENFPRTKGNSCHGSIKLKINNQEVPFVFFLRANPEQITYKDNS